jgi:hypothetical protein
LAFTWALQPSTLNSADLSKRASHPPNGKYLQKDPTRNTTLHPKVKLYYDYILWN